MARRIGRQRNQLPNCYYEGYLEKRAFKDRTSRKLWSCLCGTAIYFFNDMKDSNYVEKLELSQMISVTDDNSQDINLNAARFTLSGEDGIIKFTAPNAEARELWKGFILSVTQLSVPSYLALLPGQLTHLQEAIDKEIKRRQTSPDPPAVTPSLPPCYHSVSRLEAELLLEKESKRGNLLLRPGSHGNPYAISTRQEDYNGAVFKHYRLNRKENGGFDIALENPVSCVTLQDAINYLVDRTEGVMTPLILEEEYEENISYIQSDNENGESVHLVLPRLPTKPGTAVNSPVPAPRRMTLPRAGVPDQEAVLGANFIQLHYENQPTKPGTAVNYPVPAPRRMTLPRAGVPDQEEVLGATISELKQLFEKKARNNQ
ncbi:signal-transducing adaptor protein 2-like isoform X2 [Cynoglossus semilaevis]|uniref:signal-transducing adaptor protein 2-like isoform X2 n=1 Tax=Cynoglossus semilaevis TaxID=244447 RepID=UPI0007DCA60B|nr:signal-transducing adaptor protein 2-like isoform X2 [Cynoglossus semilaevis]